MEKMGFGALAWRTLCWHYFFLLWSLTDAQTRYSIPEELKRGSVVGNIAKDLGLGLTDIFDRKLRVAAEAGKQYFTVDSEKGELVVTENPLQLHRIEVEIRDINDNSPVFVTQQKTLKIAESTVTGRMPRTAKAGHLVTKVTAVDADSGHNAWISYKVAEATDASLFTVNQYTGEVRTKRAVAEQDDSSQRLLIEIRDDGEPVQSATVTVSILMEDGLHEPILDIRHKAAESGGKSDRLALYLILSLASVSVLSLVTFLILAVKCVKSSRGSASCCVRRSDCDDYKNPNRNLQIQLNTDGPIKYVEVLGGDMMSQSQSFRSCMSPMSEYSDFTLIKPSSTSDFKEVISVLDASLPDSTWTFESQQVRT
ncbi:hypothetical protein WMY93_010318 [Mugilogobius chulae]|uniref:Cadherin domain-containing protein n=1 Tax=Mugilogobius chulae TaxID=88201 RepID=A0AAW0PAU4_9GOBI